MQDRHERLKCRRTMASGAPRLLAILQCCLALSPIGAGAQPVSASRLAILQAMERGAQSPADLQTLRRGAQAADGDTARIALRALGQLERPALVPNIQAALTHRLPEVRSEAANALAQAAAGFSSSLQSNTALSGVQSALALRLTVETESAVRAVLYEAIARLPYRANADVQYAARAILARASDARTVGDRVGIARALEAIVRLHQPLWTPDPETLALLRSLARGDADRPGPDVLRDGRVRRLALEALTTAGALDTALLDQASQDQDPQVRRLAIRAGAATRLLGWQLERALTDVSPLVRLEALTAIGGRGDAEGCRTSLGNAIDADMAIALTAIDLLALCAESSQAILFLEAVVRDRSELDTPRGWHRNAHALIALATAAPERIGDSLFHYSRARFWRVRQAAAKAGAALHDRPTLELLAADPDDRVADLARRSLNVPLRDRAVGTSEPLPPLTADELRRLSAPRARVTVKDVGRFELALFTAEAPLSVIRFAKLAESGYYNGTSFDLVAPNSLLRTGYRDRDSASYLHEEVGLWPHVRGAVGIATPDTGDAQFFVNLVDNPRFDHRYTVFAQILNGSDVVDRILEGDVIESIEILP